jgi:hypothetical protein
VARRHGPVSFTLGVMRCPSCQREFGFLYSFRVLNPFKHRCRSCGALLTLGSAAAVGIAGAVLVGLAVAGVAIYMEEYRRWSTDESLLWLAVVLPLAGVALQWIFWRVASFKLWGES